jgi:NAD(P)-dependent dehydrogenase (short-subunit alcohol dehydrogenase family)
MSLLALLKGKGSSGFGYGSTAEEVTAGVDLSGKTVLITGCNSGIGRETLRVLALRGAHVVACARTEETARSVSEDAGAAATPVACELSQPESIQDCVRRVKQFGRPLDVILCNAGIMALPRLRQYHGFEAQFFVNHIGHFMLVSGLIDCLAPAGRVVVVSSRAHHAAPAGGIQFDNLSGERGYRPWSAYGQSKLANLLFARELGRRFEGSARTANALHPGVIKTNLGRNMSSLFDIALGVARPLFVKTIAQGAATQCYLASEPRLEQVSGKYFADCNEARSSTLGRDMELAARLWKESESIVARLRERG